MKKSVVVLYAIAILAIASTLVGCNSLFGPPSTVNVDAQNISSDILVYTIAQEINATDPNTGSVQTSRVLVVGKTSLDAMGHGRDRCPQQLKPSTLYVLDLWFPDNTYLGNWEFRPDGDPSNASYDDVTYGSVLKISPGGIDFMPKPGTVIHLRRSNLQAPLKNWGVI